MIFKKLFGKNSRDEVREGDAVEYNGYVIIPSPKTHNGQYLTSGKIRKTLDDESKEQVFIRADSHANWDDACTHSIQKGKQIIDEQGDGLFKDNGTPI